MDVVTKILHHVYIVPQDGKGTFGIPTRNFMTQTLRKDRGSFTLQNETCFATFPG